MLPLLGPRGGGGGAPRSEMFPAGGAPRNRSAGIAPLSVAKHIQFSNTGGALSEIRPSTHLLFSMTTKEPLQLALFGEKRGNQYVDLFSDLPALSSEAINSSDLPPLPTYPYLPTSYLLPPTCSPGRRPRPLICPSDRRRCPDPQTQESLHTAPQAATPDL